MSMYRFKRPESLSFPQVYYKFKAKDNKSEKIVEYIVQDLPFEITEDVVSLMLNHYITDEPIGQAFDISNKQETINTYVEFWRETIKEKLSIACFKTGGCFEFVGANLLVVNSKDDSDEDESDDPEDIFHGIDHFQKQCNIFEKFNVDQVLTGYGLCVKTDYRGLGIGTEMLKARVPVLKALQLNVTKNVFSSLESQKAATKAGYREIYEVPYAEVERQFPCFNFSGIATKNFKIQALTL